jgi:hypothetical protein
MFMLPGFPVVKQQVRFNFQYSQRLLHNFDPVTVIQVQLSAYDYLFSLLQSADYFNVLVVAFIHHDLFLYGLVSLSDENRRIFHASHKSRLVDQDSGEASTGTLTSQRGPL